MIIETPLKCSFHLYFSKKSMWCNENEADEWTLNFRRMADSYIYKRLLFETPKQRRKNVTYFIYNPYLMAPNCQDLEDLYGPPPELIHQEKSKNNNNQSIRLKTELENMMPYIIFLKRIHEDVMETPTTTHLMFQKSLFYEVLFFYCLNKTSQDTLTNVILGANDMYFGFCISSIDKMILKYTGKQYMAIVPRGLGKTRCIKLVTAVALITFRGCEIFTMAHIKSLSSALKDDVESILLTKFPPSKFNYRLFKHQDSIIISFYDDSGKFNRLKYASACNPASLRGNDPHIGFLDETLCVSRDSYAVINAMNQRSHTKIGFVSSPIANKKEDLINLVVNMPIKCNYINLYRLCYFCLDKSHVNFSYSQTGCYRKMYAPKHIMYTNDNKNFEGVLTRSNESYENELGIIHPEEIDVNQIYESDVNKCVFSNKLISHLTDPLTYLRLKDIPYESDAVYWIYLDPAFHASKQSALAICCIRFIENTAVLCFIDRKLLLIKDMGEVMNITGHIYRRCITTIVTNSKCKKCHFFVSVERNSNADWAHSFYDYCGDPRKHHSTKHVLNQENCEFFFYAKVYPGRKICYGYTLGQEKKIFFQNALDF